MSEIQDLIKELRRYSEIGLLRDLCKMLDEPCCGRVDYKCKRFVTHWLDVSGYVCDEHAKPEALTTIGQRWGQAGPITVKATERHDAVWVRRLQKLMTEEDRNA